MTVENRDVLLERTDNSDWTLGDRIAYVERVIELELSGSSRSPFELMLALHELDDIRTALYRRGAPVILSIPRETPINETLEERSRKA